MLEGYTSQSRSLGLRESPDTRPNRTSPTVRHQQGPASVVLLTDMRHEQHLESAGVCMVKKLPRLSIGQMAKIAADSPLEQHGGRARRPTSAGRD